MCHQELGTGQLVLREENRLFNHTHSHVPYSPDGMVETGNNRSGPNMLRAASEHHALVSGCTQSDTHYHTHHVWTSNCNKVAVLMDCQHFLSLDFPQT